MTDNDIPETIIYLDDWQSQIPPCFSNSCKILSLSVNLVVDWKKQEKVYIILANTIVYQ
jgi:hypothetical protein